MCRDVAGVLTIDCLLWPTTFGLHTSDS
jgi:hypothetical protein